jgi:MFS family permease
VVAAPYWWLALVGFFLVGLAICTVVPLTFSIAGGLDDAGAGIAQAGAMGYGGMLIGPAAIGYVANATSVRTGLLISVALGVVITILARTVSRVDLSTQVRAVDMAEHT